jgi:hypothetical protein
MRRLGEFADSSKRQIDDLRWHICGAAARLCPRRSLCALPHPPRCGLRGGYFELQGFDADVVTQMLKLRSISLCSNVVGQFATGLMVRRLAAQCIAFASHRACDTSCV